MTVQDRSYFLTRAEDELKLARTATHEKAARAHFLLAGAYFDLAYGPPVTSGGYDSR